MPHPGARGQKFAEDGSRDPPMILHLAVFHGSAWECLAAVTLYRLHQRNGLRRPWRLQPPRLDPRAAAPPFPRAVPNRPRDAPESRAGKPPTRLSAANPLRTRAFRPPVPHRRPGRPAPPPGSRPRSAALRPESLASAVRPPRDVWTEVVRVWALVLTAPGGLLRGDPPGRSVQVPIRLEAHPELGGGIE